MTSAVLTKKEMNAYIRQQFNQALREHWIQVYYQPVVRTLSGAICSYEALARWQDPIYGLLSPAKFIPVLEKEGLIHELDLYVAEQICIDMNTAERLKMTVVPVSLNLSRQDFKNCDVFEEIERIVRFYHVPQSFIHIELTESMIIENQTLLKRELDRFRSAGYPVKMDDFGSGYSSLNVLKDFTFDSIKLDMTFMSTLNEQSRTILQYMASMIKALGVETIAEGVETEEQMKFLKEIGCEKMQGYYFGRPMSWQDMQNSVLAQGRVRETREWMHYYDQLGTVDLFSDKAISITEFDGENFGYPYISDKYLEVWQRLGIKNLDRLLELLNSPVSTIYKQMREYKDALLKTDDFVDMDISVNGEYIRLHSKCIASHRERCSFYVELDHAGILNSVNKERDKMDQVFRMLYPIYDSVYVMDFNKGTIESIIQNVFSDLPEYATMMHAELDQIGVETARYFIHPDDRTQYLAFASRKTLLQRISELGKGYVSGYFRTRDKNGGYVWKIHQVIYVQEWNSVIYTIKPAHLEQEGLLDKLSARTITYDSQSTEALLWKQLMESQTLNLFWKDENRRFLGANAKFLNTYQFNNVSDIVGKTDEDMQWHIDDEPFREQEENLLQTGQVSANQVGTNIIRGVVHQILATKEPLYRDGEIAGLFGYFINIDEVAEKFGEKSVRKKIDSVTGLMSSEGFAQVMHDYMDEWVENREDFAVVRIKETSYKRALKMHGEEVAHHGLVEVGNALSDCAGNRAACARLYGADFAALMKFSEKKQVERFMRDVKERLSTISDVDGVKVSISVKTEMLCADEITDFKDMISFASVPDEIGATAAYQKQMMTEEIISKIPGAIVVMEATQDSDLRELYVSEKTKDILGVKHLKKANFEKMILRVLEEDRNRISAAAMHAVHYRDEFDEIYRMMDDFGKVRWIHLIATPVPQNDGNCLFYGVYTDVTEMKKIEQKETDTLRHDVTGVLSRMPAIQEIETRLAAGSGEMYALVMMDLDNLKFINDRLGHPSGDAAIQAIADILRSTFRKTDVIGRIGGDEFMVFAEGIGEEKLKSKLQDIIHMVNDVEIDKELVPHLGCSIGYVYAPHGAYSFKTAYNNVDRALYHAKRQGKNRYLKYQKVLTE